MKRIISLAVIAVMFSTAAFADTQSTRQSIRERRLLARESKTELESKATKAAQKEARALKKDGWQVAPGQLPLEKQLDRSYKMYYEFEDNGLPKYIVGDAMSPGKMYDAAKMQALEIAKTNLAGQIQTEVTALIESTVANEQVSQTDAESIARTVQASKNLIVQRIGRVIPVMECYKNNREGTVQVRVTIAYNSKMAIDDAKAVIKAQLEQKGLDLHEQLDKIWEQNGAL